MNKSPEFTFYDCASLLQLIRSSNFPRDYLSFAGPTRQSVSLSPEVPIIVGTLSESLLSRRAVRTRRKKPEDENSFQSLRFSQFEADDGPIRESTMEAN
jgi:hypothetical protein